MSDLDKLLNDYEKRKKEERLAEQTKEIKDQEQHSKAVDAFRTIILPVLKEISAPIEQRGHKISVTEHLEKPGSVKVDLMFSPITPGTARHALPSALHFSAWGESIGLNEDMSHKGGGSSSSSVTGIRLSDITIDWVRSEALAFIERVLKAN